MDLEGGISLINQAMEQTKQDYAYQLWVSIYPHMENPPAFDEFCRPVQNKKSTKTISAKEVIERAERIRLADQERR